MLFDMVCRCYWARSREGCCERNREEWQKEQGAGFDSGGP